MLSGSAEHDQYWRLSQYDGTIKKALVDALTEEGRIASMSMTKDVLIKKKQLSDCGRLPYESKRFSDRRLKRFIWDRGFVLQRKPKPRRSQLIAILERADRRQVFSRFTDLPPELRERVYNFYLDEFPEVLTFPTQPPLARTCRLLRHEVLPLFYKLKTFRLFFGLMEIARGARPCLETIVFLERLPMGLRRIQIVAGYRPSNWNLRYGYDTSDVRFRVSAGSPKRSPSLKLEYAEWPFIKDQSRNGWARPTNSPLSHWDELEAALRAKMCPILNTICADLDIKSLRKEDIEVLQKATSEVMWPIAAEIFWR